MRWPAVAIGVMLLPGCLALLPPAVLPAAGTFAAGKLLVEFAPNTPQARIRQIQHDAGATAQTAITSDIWRASVPSGREAQAISRLMANREVLHAEVDSNVHDDMIGGFRPLDPQIVERLSRKRRVQDSGPPNPLYPASGDGILGEWGMRAIGAPPSQMGGAGVEVAVVDTGVDITHPDLVNNLDLAEGGNFFDPSLNSQPIDDFGHGTHVAGIIAAQWGTIGTVGVAPAAKIIPIRVLGVDGGTTDQLIAGLDHVLGTKARVVNMSLGSQQSSAIEQDEIDKLVAHDIVVVAAAGNEALDGNPLEYPASIPGAISVAATKQPDPAGGKQAEHADFSNFNPFVTVAAPGVDILSTVPQQVAGQGSASGQGTYAYASGTSMATPMVSGVVALILSAHPNYTVDQVKQALLSTSGEPPSIGPGFNSFFGYGVVNAQAAASQ